MKSTSWTLAAPFKEQKYDRTPSESIANVYTPTASNLKLKDLPKLYRTRSKCNTFLYYIINAIFLYAAKS